MKLLLGRKDVNPDIPDTIYGQTPLLWAAEKGHEGILMLLLGRKEVNSNSSNQRGQKPLMLAANNQHHKVVELLQAPHSKLIQ